MPSSYVHNSSCATITPNLQLNVLQKLKIIAKVLCFQNLNNIMTNDM
uniref:Uncharacterized protein n=1 Tax=Nelumbo nucifera TaxID=4432 RepID=A0A822XQD2_NELNU|nr:TPA_asm: hypothetical protein HUJ06_022398 [Nelumbo nucifera]